MLQSDRARRLQQVDFFASLRDRHHRYISPAKAKTLAGKKPVPKKQSNAGSVQTRRQAPLK
jgi:hypothetical protein